MTGHSLGAAIATLFAVVASAEIDSVVPKPVTCVSFGSPYVGNQSFSQCHKLLEKMGNLRHIRVTNQMDLITTLPMIAMSEYDTLYNLLFDEDTSVGALYRNVGMNIKLRRSSQSVKFTYPKVSRGYLEEMSQHWESSPMSNISLNYFKDDMHYHQISTYNRRLAAKKNALKIIELNKLYQQPDIVGDLCAKIWY